MWNDKFEDTDELYHYGRKGMKWGQNIFGKVKRKVSESHARRKEEKRIEKLMKKPVRKLTEAELKERTKRLNDERTVLEAERTVKNLSNDNISAGKKFIKEALSGAAKQIVAPALIDAGKKALGKILDDKLNPKSERDKLKDEVDLLDLKVKKKSNEDKLAGRGDDDDDLAKAAKRAGYSKTIYEAMNARRKYEQEVASDQKPKSKPIYTDFVDDDNSGSSKTTRNTNSSNVRSQTAPAKTKSKKRKRKR